MKNKSFGIAIGIIIVIAVLFFVLKENFKPDPAPATPVSTAQDRPPQQSFSVVPPSPELLIRSHSPVLGPFTTKVTIVEFLDPECEACRAMYPHTKRVLKEFGDQVRLVVRYMPFHQNSLLAANVLEGARAQNKYWEAMELLFEKQPEWAAHHSPRPELIPEILKPLGLDMKKIMKDAEDGKYTEQIKMDQADGEKVGVRATPTFFINGLKLEDMGYEPLREAVQRQLSGQ